MPLLKRTVKHIYYLARAWERPDRRLLRDPSLPSSDVEKLLGTLCGNWDHFVGSTTHIFSKASQVPKGLTVFKRKWIGKLVPYKKAYVEAGVYAPSGGRYTLGQETEWKSAQSMHRNIVEGSRIMALQRKQSSTQHP
ncbi:hypothetical protein B0T09DRAFT_268640 [Sordaria sp. MPI-SDFR-AT-0083]|nr:hypothetical protein B0T09DRAFT_268640 [Sordaria sp. MPI-SDFR-AT-0083]